MSRKNSQGNRAKQGKYFFFILAWELRSDDTRFTSWTGEDGERAPIPSLSPAQLWRSEQKVPGDITQWSPPRGPKNQRIFLAKQAGSQGPGGQFRGALETRQLQSQRTRLNWSREGSRAAWGERTSISWGPGSAGPGETQRLQEKRRSVEGGQGAQKDRGCRSYGGGGHGEAWGCQHQGL